MKRPSLTVIGVLHGDIRDVDNAPKSNRESERVGTLEIFPKFAAGLDGIAAGQTIVVLFWLHRAERTILRVHPRGDRRRKMRGVFATRSPMRPNPIAVSELLVTTVSGTSIGVSGLDIIDGTPIIDIKMKI